MSLEIYLDLFSQPCRSVYIFAKKNNIQFDHKKISLFEGMISLYKTAWSLFVCSAVYFDFAAFIKTFHMEKSL